jgi:hypothetical protein
MDWGRLLTGTGFNKAEFRTDSRKPFTDDGYC